MTISLILAKSTNYNTTDSGSTGVAAKLLNRNFIGIELNEEYFKIAQQRIANTQPRLL